MSGMDVLSFLRDRLDEDEVSAQAATASLGHDYHGMGCEMSREDEAHIARHAPQRVLAEVAAKRSILGVHDPSHDPCDAHAPDYSTVPCVTLLYLAAVYADHPDYDQAWRP